MVEEELPTTFLSPLLDGEVEILVEPAQIAGDCETLLFQIDPHSLDLPGPNWVYSKMSDITLMIYEVTMPVGLGSPRIRKHIFVDMLNRACTSWIMDRKISEVNFSTKNDVERCIEELDMLNVCPGGPSVTRYPIMNHPNAQVDIYDNWRENSCKIIIPGNDQRCNACENLPIELARTSARNKPKGDTAKRVVISNLSHRKQTQILFLRKRRLSWYRKKRLAEKEMMHIDDMIAEVSEEPEDDDNYCDDD
ncbi:uncharacterized protein [Venturia canescens]|uniref:uncharacterized protein n=1 Tax=Venturia canescens TaxID=32260 RepID=UPI001C9C14D4|nr:uncharacterized protein LOC122414973 [Venturia canescens]